MKRLAGALFIITLAFLIPATMASAQIRGSFAFDGHSTCLLAYGGFNASFQPMPVGAPGVSDTISGPWEGTLTFYAHGKGHLDATERTIDIGNPSSNAQHNVWDFHYTVNNGVITFTYVTGSYVGLVTEGPNAGQPRALNILGPWHGRISPDGNHLTMFWGAPLLLEPTLDQANAVPIFILPPEVSSLPLQVSCNAAFQGFRIGW